MWRENKKLNKNEPEKRWKNILPWFNRGCEGVSNTWLRCLFLANTLASAHTNTHTPNNFQLRKLLLGMNKNLGQAKLSRHSQQPNFTLEWLFVTFLDVSVLNHLKGQCIDGPAVSEGFNFPQNDKHMTFWHNNQNQSYFDTMSYVIQKCVVDGLSNVAHGPLHVARGDDLVGARSVLICGKDANLPTCHLLFMNVHCL